MCAAVTAVPMNKSLHLLRWKQKRAAENVRARTSDSSISSRAPGNAAGLEQPPDSAPTMPTTACAAAGPSTFQGDKENKRDRWQHLKRATKHHTAKGASRNTARQGRCTQGPGSRHCQSLGPAGRVVRAAVGMPVAGAESHNCRARVKGKKINQSEKLGQG